MIVPTLCVGMPPVTLCVTPFGDAERPGLHSHAERGNDHALPSFGLSITLINHPVQPLFPRLDSAHPQKR
ncbi:hypothetical protein CUN61_02585 [Pseudomonas arsenicoxydans]|uniref:Uncharacterized protein n=1 Tax=Pseudomonas arsenicoxydans TaxID=702115 RepID=A0A4P6FYZ9_9PSED|nr:hypothetical protein CUN61_02585 [Pseudomonas arsenicoxydans]